MISEVIKARLKNASKRFFASDNISQFIYPDEKPHLIDEITKKFEGVLSSLIIDTDNDRRIRRLLSNEQQYYNKIEILVLFINFHCFGKFICNNHIYYIYFISYHFFL